jgi:hypothetical protein
MGNREEASISTSVEATNIKDNFPILLKVSKMIIEHRAEKGKDKLSA